MRRVLLLVLVLLLALPSVWAQNIQTTITANSGRYSLTVPRDWVVSSDPLWYSFQSILPLESIVVADSDATLDILRVQQVDLFDALDTVTIEGALLAGTVWPQALVEETGLTPETLGVIISTSAEGQVEQVPFSHELLQGTYYKRTENNQVFHVLPLTDKQGNLVLLLGISDAAHSAELEAVVGSLAYTLFSARALLDTTPSNLTPLTLIQDVIMVDIPLGWWVLQVEENTMAVPQFSPEFIAALQESNFAGGSSLLLMALQKDKADLPPEAYDADGSLNPEGVVALFVLASVLGENTDDTNFDSVQDMTQWSNEHGLSGLQMEMGIPDQDGAVARMIILDTGDELTIVMSLTAASATEDYRATVDTIFASARLVE